MSLRARLALALAVVAIGTAGAIALLTPLIINRGFASLDIGSVATPGAGQGQGPGAGAGPGAGGRTGPGAAPRRGPRVDDPHDHPRGRRRGPGGVARRRLGRGPTDAAHSAPRGGGGGRRGGDLAGRSGLADRTRRAGRSRPLVRRHGGGPGAGRGGPAPVHAGRRPRAPHAAGGRRGHHERRPRRRLRPRRRAPAHDPRPGPTPDADRGRPADDQPGGGRPAGPPRRAGRRCRRPRRRGPRRGGPGGRGGPRRRRRPSAGRGPGGRGGPRPGAPGARRAAGQCPAPHAPREAGSCWPGRAATAGVVRIEVRDTGPGIAAEDLPHVFDRLYQADPARDRRTGSSGLGLAIVRALVEAQGGRVGAGTAPEGGALVWMELPRA